MSIPKRLHMQIQMKRKILLKRTYTKDMHTIIRTDPANSPIDTAMSWKFHKVNRRYYRRIRAVDVLILSPCLDYPERCISCPVSLIITLIDIASTPHSHGWWRGTCSDVLTVFDVSPHIIVPRQLHRLRISHISALVLSHSHTWAPRKSTQLLKSTDMWEHHILWRVYQISTIRCLRKKVYMSR